MLKKSFFLIFCIFFVFFFKNVKSATPKIVMECPGLKNFKNWCAGEYKGNSSKSCIMISSPISEKGDPPYKSRGEAVATVYHMPAEDNNGVIWVDNQEDSYETGDPPYKSRGEVIATIYHMPSEDNNGVVYITAGYTYKKDAVVTVKIDQNKEHEFNIIEADSAFSDDDNVDKQIIVEMKKGNKMKVIGFSSRGTETTDIYSLVGFTSAYTYISNLCNVKN